MACADELRYRQVKEMARRQQRTGQIISAAALFAVLDEFESSKVADQTRQAKGVVGDLTATPIPEHFRVRQEDGAGAARHGTVFAQQASDAPAPTVNDMVEVQTAIDRGTAATIRRGGA